MKIFSTTKPNRSTLLRAVGTLLALALLIFLLSQQGWQAIWLAIQQIPPLNLILAFIIMMISRLAVVGRWHVLLRSGGLDIPPSQSLRITFAGLFATNFLPTTIGGDVVRLAGAVQLRYDAAVVAASLIADRLIGLIGMAMVLPFGIPLLLEENNIPILNSGTQTIIISGVISPSLSNRWKKIRERGTDIIRRLLVTLSLWLKQPGSLLLSLLFSWVNMIGLFSVLTLLFRGMGEDIAIWQVGSLYSFVYLVTLLPISINGYGLQEISMTFVFSNIADIPLANALTAALLFRTLMMLASLPGALFLPGILPGTREHEAL